MIYYLRLLLLSLLSILILSCSDDDSTSEMDPLIGTWEGEVVQPGFGTSTLILTISSLNENSKSGELVSEVTDLSDCDDSVYHCVFDSCETEWVYQGRSGATYLFLEKADPSSSCADGNISAVINGNRLNYTWTDLTDPNNTSSAMLSKQ